MRTKTIARWRRAVLAGTLAGTLALPTAALAQQPSQPAEQPAQEQPQPAAEPAKEAPPAPAEAKPKGENAPVITEQSPRPPPDTDIKPVPGTPEEYTIIKGDTLWDLSQKFLNNPWYWPKIWSLNPSIENPHWIYPGNKLRIVPGEGGAQAPAQVEAPTQGADVESASASAAPEEQPVQEPEGSQSVTPPASPDLEV